MKFAYYAAVGNADFNYGEFVDLRRKLDAGRHPLPHSHLRRPAWMGSAGSMDRGAELDGHAGHVCGNLAARQSRIQQTLASEIASAREFQSQNNPLAALREYQSIVRDFRGLADVSVRRDSPAELAKNKAVKAAEKEEASALDQQTQMTSSLSAQMQAIEGDRERSTSWRSKSSITDLKKRADRSRNSNDLKALVAWRALGRLVVEAYESRTTQSRGEELPRRRRLF